MRGFLPVVGDWMRVILAVALGLAFLLVFYRAIRLQWPGSYFGATDTAAYAISATPWRYLAFRSLPVFVIGLFVAVSLDRARAPGWVGAMLLGLCYALPTSGWPLVRWARMSKAFRRGRMAIVLLQGVGFLIVVLAALAAGFARNLLAPVVPEINDLAAAVWTAFAAAVLGAFVVRVSVNAGTNEMELVERAIRNTPRELMDLAGRLAKEADADPNLVRAIMVTENVERPPWFRRLERIKAKVLPGGTYGIMQVGAPRPLSDVDSIRKAISERLSGVSITGADGRVDHDRLAAFARGYNPDPNFRAFLECAFSEVSRVTDNRTGE